MFTSALNAAALETDPLQPNMIALTNEARSIALKLQCPVCDGQSIVESQAAVSVQMKQKVQELVDQGKSEQEILNFFEERYGMMVLREPPYSGFGLGAWLIPPIVIGSIVIWFSFILRRKNQQYKDQQ
tara:strand:- start:1072 stop:1455 length:384 start_codon:yes stop_codon:yes gene_type:complete